MTTVPAEGEIIVVKVGGSLFDLPDLGERLERFVSSAGGRAVLVPGGGGLAEELRRLDGIHRWPCTMTHRWAIETMSLSARLIAALRPNFTAADSLPAVGDAIQAGHVPVLDVAALPGLEQLPASWDVTSDSIAAWAAKQLGVSRLVLAKSIDPPGRDPSVLAAAAAGAIDRYFPIAAQGLDVRWINLRCGDETQFHSSPLSGD